MNKSHYHRLASYPFEISELGYNYVQSLIHSKELDTVEVEPGYDYWGNKASGVEIKGNVGFVRVNGMLVNGYGRDLAARWGACSIPDLRDDIAELGSNPQVEFIVLDINSPGGHAVGNRDIATTVDEVTKVKSVIGFTRGLMASAAYKVAAPCNAIFAAPGSQVGSVGTFCVFWGGESDMRVFRSGIHKGAGIDGFTEEQEAEIQRQVDRLGDEFRAIVRSKRNVSDDDMQGQIFTGIEAAEKGFVDGVAYTPESALKTYQKLTTQV